MGSGRTQCSHPNAQLSANVIGAVDGELSRQPHRQLAKRCPGPRFPRIHTDTSTVNVLHKGEPTPRGEASRSLIVVPVSPLPRRSPDLALTSVRGTQPRCPVTTPPSSRQSVSGLQGLNICRQPDFRRLGTSWQRLRLTVSPKPASYIRRWPGATFRRLSRMQTCVRLLKVESGGLRAFPSSSFV